MDSFEFNEYFIPKSVNNQMDENQFWASKFEVFLGWND